MTLQFDESSAAFFAAAREAHFPAAINRVPAHLTLFHNLPGEELETVVATSAGIAGRTAPFPIAVDGLIALGRGVAYRLSSRRLERLRAELAEAFAPWLIAQDRQRFRAHVTVQNKVEPATARATQAELEAAFEPFTAHAEGLQLWRYRGGPWTPAGAIAFGSAADR